MYKVWLRQFASVYKVYILNILHMLRTEGQWRRLFAFARLTRSTNLLVTLVNHLNVKLNMTSLHIPPLIQIR